MSCPSCGGELICSGYKRAVWRTIFGRCPSSLGAHTKMQRTWTCTECGKVYVLAMKLVEAELVGTAKKL